MRPAFVSLVGLEQETDELYKIVGARLSEEFDEERCVCFDGIVEDWSKTRIAGRQKRNFTPGARFLFRWGLFYENIETIVRPAFEQGATIGLARQFGFDVYAGSLAHCDCQLTIQLHWPLVQHVIKARGLPPPLYVFTSSITDFQRHHMRPYFANGTGQRFRRAPAEWSLEEKVDFIMRLYHEELASKGSPAKDKLANWA